MPKTKYIIAILIDNANGDKFIDLIQSGKLPNLKEHIFDRGSFSRHSICQFPSSSSNGHSTLATGTFQSKHGVLYAIYWDFPKQSPVPMKIDSINLSTIKIWDKILTAKTMFEYIPNKNSASFHIIKRGAGFKFFELKNLLRYLPLFLKLKFKGADVASKKTGFLENALLNIFQNYIKRFKKKRDFYQLTFIMFLPTDLKAHKNGHDSGEYYDSLRLIDSMVKVLVNGFEFKGTHYPGLKERGLYDDTAFALFADHSSKPFSHDKMVDIVADLKKDFPWRLYSAPRVDKKERIRQWDVLTVGGAEFLQVHLPDENRRTKHIFSNEEIIAYGFNGSTINFKDYFFKYEAVARIYFPTNPDTIIVLGRSGAGRIIRQKNGGNGRSYKYEITEGIDPLAYSVDTPAMSDGEFHSHLEWLRETSGATYPNVPDHMFGFFDSPLAPTFIVTTVDGWVFYHPEDLTDHTATYNYQHDAEYRVEVTTPLVIGGAGVKKGIEVSVCQNVDLLPTLLKLLGIPFASTDFDGRPLDEIIE